MKILITGSSGLVGTSLVSSLSGKGHDLIRLTRTPSTASGTIILWDPHASEVVRDDRLEDLDVAVHLAGENIGSGRWTPLKKASIRNSRVQGTGLLSRTLSHLNRPPKVFISASATGFYGNRGDELLTEESPIGEGFLPGVCRDWEEATELARDRMRVVMLRTGFILSPRDGGLARMLPMFKAGLGGVVGNGRQWMSWIDLEDVVGVIHLAMRDNSLTGPLNVVSPEPVRNREFTKILGKVLGRPTFLPLPAFLAEAALGEMAEELLLASARVKPEKLARAGYSFKYPLLEASLRHCLAAG